MGSLSLSKMAESWTGSLQNSMTIEIPYVENQNELTAQTLEFLKDHPIVSRSSELSETELSELLKPWLGSLDQISAALPMPKLISVELKTSDPAKIADFKSSLENISPKISVDSHEEWLDDLKQLTGTIQLIGILLVIFISIVTFFTVSGAVRSRMAIHQTELELLHIMGAHDRYIRTQFQHYIVLLTGRGIIYGIMATASFILVIAIISSQFPATIPQLHLYPIHALAIPTVALALIIISIGAARHTVNHVLRDIP
jgi:cell division transport system permease protein